MEALDNSIVRGGKRGSMFKKTQAKRETHMLDMSWRDNMDLKKNKSDRKFRCNLNKTEINE